MPLNTAALSTTRLALLDLTEKVDQIGSEVKVMKSMQLVMAQAEMFHEGIYDVLNG